jgi:chemotaxis protein MotB
MKHPVLVGVVLGLAVFGLGGCVTHAAYDNLRADNMELSKHNRELAAENSELSLQMGVLQGQLSQKDATISGQRDEIAMLNQKITFLTGEIGKGPGPGPEVLPPPLKSALEQLVAEAGGLLTLEGPMVRLKSDILFASGQHEVKDAARQTLAQFAQIFLQQGVGFKLRIDGHTDNDPIDKSRKRYDDNWDLSYERAHAVLTILTDSGIPGDQVFLAAFGEYTPRVSNDSAANKAQNRRVDILLMSEETYRNMALR